MTDALIRATDVTPETLERARLVLEFAKGFGMKHTALPVEVLAALLNAAERLPQVEAERDRLKAALEKVNTIRNSIVGLQTVNYSEHVYPLVAALNEAGLEGMGYPRAREHFGTMLERAVKAEATLDRVRVLVDQAVGLCPVAGDERRPYWAEQVLEVLNDA